MIVDFQHHFTPLELFPEGFAGEARTFFDSRGVPAYSFHSLLHDLDAHIEMMDIAGIDVAMLSCAEGMCAPLDKSRLINDRAFKAGQDYPGRFTGFAHAHPLGGSDALAELARCRHELGFEGVVITSEFDGTTVDDPALDPFWARCQELGVFVFIHPALRLTRPEPFDAYDLARSVGREFSLIQAIIRLVNGGVLDRFPELRVHVAHLGGGIASMLGRIRSYQDKSFWGTADSPRQWMPAGKGF